MHRQMIATVFRSPGGLVIRQFYCVDDNEKVNTPISNTLLDFIYLCAPDETLEQLISQAQAGKYSPANPNLPDWGINDVNLWLPTELTQQGLLKISNENTDQSEDSCGGVVFTFQEFWAAMEHWKLFLRKVETEGEYGMVNQPLVAPFPRDERRLPGFCGHSNLTDLE